MKKIIIILIILVAFISGFFIFVPHKKFAYRYIKDMLFLVCDKPQYCNNLVMVNCGAEVDGPLYYFDKNTGEKISTCGGSCNVQNDERQWVCENLCPPEEWTCE